MLAIILIIISVVLILLYLIFRPSIDYINDSILIWYNEEPYKRTFFKIKIK